MAGELRILHVDMDAFFAAVEVLDDPSLAGKPIVVGHDGPRGVVATASYEARQYGCHSAQPIAVAKRCCPHLIILPGRSHRYRELSQQVFAILDSITPLVEPVSIDEAFLDVRGVPLLGGDGPRIAQHIRERVRTTTGLTCSVGVSSNKFLAKVASELRKPDGLSVLAASQVRSVLGPLPIAKLWGVGPAMEQRFLAMGVRTIGDLQQMPIERLRQRMGEAGEHFHRLANGIDPRPVSSDHTARSLSQEHTYTQDVDDPLTVRARLVLQLEQVAHRLRRLERCARTVTIKIRYGDFQTITRSTTLPQPSDRTQTLVHAATTLFDQWAQDGFRPVRLIGGGVSQLAEAGAQLNLFADPADGKQAALDRTVDRIVARFGKGAVHRGALPPERDPTYVDERPPTQHEND